MNPRRLYRSADDRYIAGVAGGVADYFNVDPVIVRILWVLSVPFTGSLTFWIYLVMAVVVPLEPAEWPEPSPWAPGGTPLGYDARYAPPAGTTPPADQGAGISAAGTGAAWPAPDAGSAPFSAGPAPAQDAGTVPPAAASPTDWRWQRRQDHWQRRAEGWDYRHERSNSPGIVFGLLLILVGGLVAWHQIDPHVDLGLAWPVAIIAFGVILVVSSIGWRRGNK